MTKDYAPPPKPEGSFNVGGWRPTRRVRIRSGFLCFPVVEELWEKSDGSSVWKRLPWMSTVEIKS